MLHMRHEKHHTALAFHSKFECMKKRNPNMIEEEIKTLFIDEDGYELEDDETHSGNE